MTYPDEAWEEALSHVWAQAERFIEPNRFREEIGATVADPESGLSEDGKAILRLFLKAVEGD